MKAKYGKKAKLCYLATDGFTVYTKIDDIYKDTAEDVEKKLGASNYELNRPLPKRKNKKVIAVIKSSIRWKIMKEFVEEKSKLYTYLINDGSGDKKIKD